SGAGRTSDGNGSHASTLKSPSYTKSVSWQHYPERCAAAKIVPCCGFLTKLPDSTKSAESYNTCLGQ
ncbi:hypothetical protein, partial [Escherichia coli]|uniref:hypothetical protein n=2 Tax=Escherichia coli TaxID=562 RepID=UPI001BC8543E